jgi:hypothetical protein
VKPAVVSWLCALVVLAARLIHRLPVSAPGRWTDVATDALACIATVIFLAAPNAVRTLAGEGNARRSVLSGLVALSSATWMFALLPPRPGNYWANGAQSDLFFAYLPLSVAALPVAVLSAFAWNMESPLAVATRVAAVSATLCLGLGLVVRFICMGYGADEVLGRGVMMAGGGAAAAAALAVAERRTRIALG